MFQNLQTKYSFLFLKVENKVLLDNIFKLFSIIFTCFLRVVLKNNYANTKND